MHQRVLSEDIDFEGEIGRGGGVLRGGGVGWAATGPRIRSTMRPGGAARARVGPRSPVSVTVVGGPFTNLKHNFKTSGGGAPEIWAGLVVLYFLQNNQSFSVLLSENVCQGVF